MGDKWNETIPAFRGTPKEVGEQFSLLNRAPLLQRFNGWLVECTGGGYSREELIRKSGKYIAAAEELAPWLLEEAGAMARVLGISPDLFVSSIALQKLDKSIGSMQKDDDCTSIMVVGDAAAGGRSILHKNRDNDIGAQSVYIKEILYRGESLNRVIGTSYLYDFGINAFVNDKGVSGVVNAGEDYPNPSTGGLTTPTILRVVAEKASCCEDVLEIILPILSRPNYYCTHRNRGSIWLFVDGEKGLIIENTAHVAAFSYVYNDIEVRANDFLLLDRDHAVGRLGRERPGGLVRRERVLRRLMAWKGAVTPEMVIGAARDWEPAVDTSGWTEDETEAYLFANICKTKTVSGFTGIVPAERADVLSCGRVMNGHPNNVYAVPLYTGCEGVLLPHVNGELSLLSYRLLEANPIGENRHLNLNSREKEISQRIENLEREAGELLKRGKAQMAKEILTEECGEISRWAVDLMRRAVALQ